MRGKRILSAIAAIATIFALAACNNNGSSPAMPAQSQATSADAAPSTTAVTHPPAHDQGDFANWDGAPCNLYSQAFIARLAGSTDGMAKCVRIQAEEVDPNMRAAMYYRGESAALDKGDGPGNIWFYRGAAADEQIDSVLPMAMYKPGDKLSNQAGSINTYERMDPNAPHNAFMADMHIKGTHYVLEIFSAANGTQNLADQSLMDYALRVAYMAISDTTF